MPFRDVWVECKECEERFVFTVEEQRRLTDLGLEVEPPNVCPDCREEEEMGPGPHEGVVKWFSPEKGYGFIVQRRGDEIFFHRSGITEGEIEKFGEGARVTYIIETTEKGPEATEVALL